ncbi:MAG TPA: branched-chain amino acid ABC transporter permease [Thermodesulfobacteriota bacterium]|nr:branched-chain amino acid ABC transporter permease [Thermodesulfobacteriota bacterium]
MSINRKPLIVLGLAAIAFFALLPLFIQTYFMHLLIMIFSFTYLSCAWNIIGGFAGQLSLGHALFFGIGAYTSTLLFLNFGISPWLGMVAGGALSAVFAYVIGLIIFRYRIRGVFFSMSTLCFAEIVRLVASYFRVFGGAEGLLITLGESSFWKFQFVEKEPYYYISLVMMLGMLWVTYLLKNSKYFYYFFSIKADEDAANAIGVNSGRYKTAALVLSAFFTALNGTFFAQYYMFIEPETTFSVSISVDMIIRPIIGGLGTIFGPVLGSFIMTPLSEVIRSLVGSGKSGVHLLIYGCALIAICIWMPRGILPYIGKLFEAK